MVEVAPYKRHGRLTTEAYGLGRRDCDAVSLLKALCNSRAVVVNDDDGVLDTQATFAAQAKCAKISEEFARWLFADAATRWSATTAGGLTACVRPATTARICGCRACRISSPRTTTSATRVARIINEPTVLSDHVVGAGKTGVLVAGAYELRRLGLVRQPWMVCTFSSSMADASSKWRMMADPPFR
ncbi:MAG TPA: hypothetical protein VME67_25100 [Mycobacterium sp.]|nr:hypothetical protein [Mycobacterium sp.]HTX97822.1 hypothetical protein [Mycobacterium sp.]